MVKIYTPLVRHVLSSNVTDEGETPPAKRTFPDMSSTNSNDVSLPSSSVVKEINKVSQKSGEDTGEVVGGVTGAVVGGAVGLVTGAVVGEGLVGAGPFTVKVSVLLSPKSPPFTTSVSATS